MVSQFIRRLSHCIREVSLMLRTVPFPVNSIKEDPVDGS